jgi:hypothetical protein
LITVEGKYGIKATIVADSITWNGVRLTTMELEYPRLILAELNTHRALSRNSASSRAIPFAKMKDNLTGRPVRFGEANPGMQDKGEDYNELIAARFHTIDDSHLEYSLACRAEEAWNEAKEDALFWSEAFFNAGYHKQVYNRLTEPFQMMKTIMSATEWGNFFWLRDDGAADPTIAELANCMRRARDSSTPLYLHPGQWHLPYVGYDPDISSHFIQDGEGVPELLELHDAIKVSAARCAAVSFRNVDYGLEKCKQVHERLVGDDRKHASALEHQASPMYAERNAARRTEDMNTIYPHTWEDGVSHIDRKGDLWSGNLKGWIQYRKLIPGENMTANSYHLS